MVYTNFGGFFTLLLLAALFVSVRWALSFEPLLEAWSPDLHSRNLNENMLPFSQNPDEEYPMKKKREVCRGADGSDADSTLAFPVGASRYVTVDLPVDSEEETESRGGKGSGPLDEASKPQTSGIYMKRSEGSSGGGSFGRDGSSTRILGRYSMPSAQGDGSTGSEVPKGVPLSVYKTTMPGVNEVPTTYDYSALNHQISSMTMNGGGDVEPGMIIRPSGDGR